MPGRGVLRLAVAGLLCCGLAAPAVLSVPSGAATAAGEFDGPASRRAAVRATSGLGMYVWRWEKTGTVDAVVAHAKASGISHLVVRAASRPQGFYLGEILADLLPKAHAAGIAVVAYDPPRLDDVESDVQRAHAIMSFRSQGHGVDAFAADIEPRWQDLTAENADRYGRRLREVLGPDAPLVGIVYPPNQVGPDRYPFEAVARHFDVLSPMSYWRAMTTDGPGFVRASIDQLRAYGRPVSVIGQAFAYGGSVLPPLAAHPVPAEVDAAIAIAREAGAIGMSFWVWEHAEPWVFERIAAAAWPGGGPAAGLAPPDVPPYRPPPPPRLGRPRVSRVVAAAPSAAERSRIVAAPGGSAVLPPLGPASMRPSRPPAEAAALLTLTFAAAVVLTANLSRVLAVAARGPTRPPWARASYWATVMTTRWPGRTWRPGSGS